MAADTLAKLRNLLSMKSTLLSITAEDLAMANDLVEALRADLAHAVRLIQAKDEEIQSLCEEIHQLKMTEWAQIDADENWLAEYLARDNYSDEVFAAHKDDAPFVTQGLNIELDDEIPF